MAFVRSRRQFVLGAGASLVAAPFLQLLNGRTAKAASAGPRRIVVMFSPNGTIHRHWRPTGTTGTDFALPPESILFPLADHKDRVLICDGLSFLNATNHEAGMHCMLTGLGQASHPSAGMSVDQFLATRLGDGMRFPSLELGVQTSAWGSGTQTRMSYRGLAERAEPDDDPKSVYQRVWAPLAGDAAQVEALMARRTSMLDRIRGDLATLETWVGREEKPKLQAHLESLRRVEQGLQAPADCAYATPVGLLNSQDNDQFPAIGKAQTDLLVAALACGVTRVATLQWSHTVGPPVFSWLGIGDGHHSLSHSDDGNAAGVSDFVDAERWFAEQFVYLLDRLHALPNPDGDGTLLDTTLVVWAKEMGDSRLHDCNSVPFVLAGGSGTLSLGRYASFGGASHQKLLVSICHAMGATDVTSFGDPSVSTGPLSGLVV